MPVITFYSSCKQETGNTVSAILLATYLGITKNKKILLISTGLNDTTVKDSLWPIEQKKKSGLFGPNTSIISQNGVEELDRVIRSNRVSPEIITNYTRVALRGRLEVLMGYVGSDEQYAEIEKDYVQIISLAAKAYDTVIVDLDQNINLGIQGIILNSSDIVIATTTQKLVNIEKLTADIQRNDFLNKNKTIMAIGKYDDKSRFNIKNISRNLLKQKEFINTIPYSPLVLEAAQEGKIIDIIWNLLNMRNKDENYLIIEELKRLSEKIDSTLIEVEMKK